MKWGVRRTPEQLGHHSVKKGTKVYRVSVSGKESITGATYVTYLPPDRDLYRSTYAKVLKRNQGGKENDSMVETEYTLSEDLNIPSRNTLKAAYKMAMSDQKILKEACSGIARHLVQSDEIDYLMNYGKDYKKRMKTDVKEWTDQYMKAFGSYTPDQAFAITARSLGPSSPIVKNAVIDILRKQGYNAMVDEAGVGGVAGAKREGVDPLIVFNGASSMQKSGSSSLNENSMKEAERRYRDWRTTANKHRNTSW